MTTHKQHNYKQIFGMSTAIVFIAALGALNQVDDTPAQPPEKKITYTQPDAPTAIVKKVATEFKKKAQQTFDILTENGHTISFPSQKEHQEYTHLQSITKFTFANYNGQRVPQDLRESALFTQTTIGIPHNVLFMIAQAESGFDGNSNNPHSTGNGYFHLLKDPMLELVQKTIGTPLEHLFPLAKDIVKKEHNGRSFFYLTNQQTGQIDKALTMAYHEQISKDPFLSTLTAALKISEDKKLLQRMSFNNDTTTRDTYAQYFYGGYGGKRYAKLRRNNPQAPIWKIYGSDQTTILENKKREIENIGNKNFFFNQKTGNFNTIADHENYLENKRDIPDKKWALLDADLAFAKNLRIENPHKTLSPLIIKWEKVLKPKVQIALLKQAVN